MSLAKDMMTWRAAAVWPVRAALAAYCRFQVTGREHLPAGRFIMVANHASHLDVLCLLAALPASRVGQAHAAAARDYFAAGWPRVAARLVNAVPLERASGIRRGIGACQRVFASPKGILILFPEGTRTVTGDVGQFRPGVGALLAGSDIPVVPCALSGTFAMWPKGARGPRPGHVRMVIGEARNYRAWRRGHRSNHEVSADLQQAVAGLLRLATLQRDAARARAPDTPLSAGQPA